MVKAGETIVVLSRGPVTFSCGESGGREHDPEPYDLPYSPNRCDETSKAWVDVWVPVNPYDVDKQADAIHVAPVMPEEERMRRSRALHDQVELDAKKIWIEAQIRGVGAYREQHG